MENKKKPIIDLVTHDPKKDEYILIIVHEGPWTGSQSQLTNLQDKLNAYLSFVLDGQMVKMYPASNGKKVVIRIDSDHDLDAKSKSILDKVKEHLKAHNIELWFEKYRSGDFPHLVS